MNHDVPAAGGPARHGAGKCSYRCVIVRDRARRDEHTAERVESGAVAESLRRVQGVYSGGAGRWEENCLPAGSGGHTGSSVPSGRHERHRARRKEYAGERIEPGAVTESLQGIQGGIGGRVAGDRRDGFMHRLDRLARARRLKVGGAQAAGAARCVPGDGARERGRDATFPECVQRNEHPGKAIVTGRRETASGPEKIDGRPRRRCASAV